MGRTYGQKEGPSRVSCNAPLPTAIAYQRNAYNVLPNFNDDTTMHVGVEIKDSVKVNFSQDTKGF